MNNANDPFGFMDLEEKGPIETKKSNPKYARETFKCESCNGSGVWSGGTNQYGNAKCHTCHGRGELVSSPAARAKAASLRISRKRELAAGNQADNIKNIGGQTRMDALDRAGDWSSFAGSLLDQQRNGKAWSDKQLLSINSMLDKLEANAKEKALAAEAKAAAAPAVDLTAIEELFAGAVASGYKKPSFRAEGLIIKPASGSIKNTGALYVMDDEKKVYGMYGETASYAGKVQNGRFFEVRGTESYVLPALEKIAKNPLEAALAYGRRTGRCACCGRELSKHASIDAGIGPICAQKWGF